MNKHISGEIAIAVILLIAGTFGYVFWKGALEIETGEVVLVSVGKSDGASDGRQNGEKWKIFRSDELGYEFGLPSDWKIQDDNGKFVATEKAEEISVVIEENKQEYTAQELLAQTMDAEEEANVQPLVDFNGVKIEKREGEALSQTAKLISGENVITLTYLGRSAEQSVDLFNKILPTFKAVN